MRWQGSCESWIWCVGAQRKISIILRLVFYGGFVVASSLLPTERKLTNEISSSNTAQHEASFLTRNGRDVGKSLMRSFIDISIYRTAEIKQNSGNWCRYKIFHEFHSHFDLAKDIFLFTFLGIFFFLFLFAPLSIKIVLVREFSLFSSPPHSSFTSCFYGIRT